MSLKQAHEGYEYQDLLISYFILKEILAENDAAFHIDQKQYAGDTFDDLTIETKNRILKKQIKYSNDQTARTLSKSDFSTKNYQLGIDDLFFSWQAYSERSKCEITLCLAWGKPVDELTEFLNSIPNFNSFDLNQTTVYEFNGPKFWPKSGTPPSSWQKFRRAAPKINQSEFKQFLKQLKIEVDFPKFSLSFFNPGELESIVLGQLDKIGIGYYPNNYWTKEAFALAFIALIKKARSKGLTLTAKSIFKEFSLQTNYGAIHQKFPINKSLNVSTKPFLKSILGELNSNNKIILTGAPGSGKSWFAENLKEYANKNGVNVIRHLCYTDLEDALQSQRIQLDVFYGNLINDILLLYPELSKKKAKRYASNLGELNNLLSNIENTTLLIIDGIDHIERIFKFKKLNNNLTTNDIDIITAINNLQLSNKVHVIVISQPVPELDQVVGYKRLVIPSWEKIEVQNYLKKEGISDCKIEGGTTLLLFLTEKCQGNPLYLKYLIGEIKQSGTVNSQILNTLPNYDINLNEYYSYILSKLNLNEQLPRILAGINFSLTKQEIKEITGGGSDIDESLKLLGPIIKLNVSQNGYSIYHESFRRFIIGKLENAEISIEINIFNPILSWMERKGFYKFYKSYRYYFQLLYDLNRVEDISKFISKDFIIESIFYGHSWDYIKNNYRFLAKAAIFNEDLAQIVLVNELNKTITSTEDEFYDNYLNYLEALGLANGFTYVAEYLVYDGKPTVSLILGLKVCYLCDSYDVSAPWNLYSEYFKKGEELNIEEFKYYVRKLIVGKESAELIKLYKKIIATKASNFFKVYMKELNQCNKNSTVLLVAEETRILNLKSKNKKTTIDQFTALWEEVRTVETVHHSEIDRIKYFINCIPDHIGNVPLIKKLKGQLENSNWYANWLIFLLAKDSLKIKTKVTCKDIESVLAILTYDTDPFKGKPRTSDLYLLGDTIFESIEEILGMLPSKVDNWDKIFLHLKTVSDETTTSYQKALMGPITTSKLFSLLFKFRTKENIETLTAFCEEILVEKEGYHLHAYLGEYCFELSKLNSLRKDAVKAANYFKKGIQYLLGYSGRKDSTIEDLLEGILTLNMVDPPEAKKFICKIKPLVDSVVDHTDGKGTAHFPISWFRKYIEIDTMECTLYLINELKNTQYDWRLEESIQRLIESQKGSVNPLIEALIARTFILENEEWFLDSCLDICEKGGSNDVFKSLMEQIYYKAKTKKQRGYSILFLNKLQQALKGYSMFEESDFETIVKEHIYEDRVEAPKKRPDCFKVEQLTTNSLTEFISENQLTEEEIKSLEPQFSKILLLTDEAKKLVDSFFSAKHRYDGRHNEYKLFNNNKSEIAIYYWVSRFINDLDPWNKSLVNIAALKNAYEIDPKISSKYLFDGLYKYLNLNPGSNFSANLLTGLNEIGLDSEKIKKAYISMFEGIEHKLPNKEDYQWDVVLKNDLRMSQEELLICLLFLRSKAYTTERFMQVLSGLSYLLETHSDLMVKPLKWFFINKAIFKDSIIASVLTLLYKKSIDNENLLSELRIELENIYPCNYFFIDFAIEKLLKRAKRQVILPQDSFVYPIADHEHRYYMNHVGRHKKIERAGINISNIFGKVKATYFEKYSEEIREIYANRSVRQSVSNLYTSDYVLELINRDLYAVLYAFPNSTDLFEDIKINVEQLVAQTNAQERRPSNLLKPVELEENYLVTECNESNGWIRIAHYEKQLEKKTTYYLEDHYAFGAVNFSTIHRKPPMNIVEFDMFDNAENQDDYVINFYYQKDPFEMYRIFWLNEPLMRALNIRPDKKKLCGIDINGETVLKYSNWNCDYVGEGEFSRLRDEIPKLSGAQLSIRKDYFQKLSELFTVQGSYHTLSTS